MESICNKGNQNYIKRNTGYQKYKAPQIHHWVSLLGFGNLNGIVAKQL